MAHDIFISYSHKDKAVADAVCSYMENNGLRCWYAPRDIAPGEDWASAIIDAINSTKMLVLIFTKDSNISQQVLREISNAVSSGIPIVPFRLTDEEPAAGMKYYLATVHWLDAMNSKLEAAIEDLHELCSALVQNIRSREAGDGSDEVSAEELTARLASAQAERKKTEAAAAKKKKTAIIAAAAGILLLALILLVIPKGSKDGQNGGGGGSPVSENISMDVTETYTQGNSQGCLQSGGYIATDGEKFYYRSNDNQCMYSMNPDGSDKVKLTYEPVSCISVYNGYIYYYTSSSDPTIKKMKTDGTDASILHTGMVEDLRIVGDRIYYKDSQDKLHLYSMDLDGKNVKAENDIEETYYFCLDGTYMYYSNQADGGKIYRINMDGSDPVCLVDSKTEHMTIAGNKLYYNDMGSNKFCSYDLSTGEAAELYDDYICYINVTEGGIYGYSGAQDTKLCYMQTDGLGFRIISEDPVRDVCVCGNIIMYRNDDDNKLYMVDLDGNNKTEA